MKTRYLSPLLLAAGVALAGFAGWTWAARRSKLPPRVVPLSAAVERPPYDPDAVHRNLVFLAAQAKRDAQDPITRAMLAHEYLESFRETGDIADAKRAELAARSSLKIRTRKNDAAFDALSRALLSQHRFPEALQAARRAAALNPEGFRQCADIEIELGDYEAARRDLSRSPRHQVDPAYLALAARFLELHGQQDEQLALLQNAVRQADANADVPVQSVAWFRERLGHCLFAMGRLDEAERAYRAALQVFPRDYRSMAALAHLFAARNDWAQTVKWGQRAADIVPAPETIALLGDAYAAQGRPQLAQQQFRLVGTMGALSRAQGVIYDRQRALFNADRGRDLDEALRLARGELRIRHDLYSFDTLAWVLYKKGDFAGAQAAMTRALKWGTRDATLFYHAGLISLAQGQRAQARQQLAGALSINPYFHPTAPRQVRALLARLNGTKPITLAATR